MVSEILLIALVVAVGVIVYVFVTELSGNMARPVGEQVTEQVEVTAYDFGSTGSGPCTGYPSSAGPCLVVHLMNTGASAVTVSSVYFEGVALVPYGLPGGVVLPAGSSATLELAHSGVSTGFDGLPAATSLAAGTTYELKVVTASGAQVVYDVVAGKTG